VGKKRLCGHRCAMASCLCYHGGDGVSVSVRSGGVMVWGKAGVSCEAPP
jgi:hypothetical protein